MLLKVILQVELDQLQGGGRANRGKSVGALARNEVKDQQLQTRSFDSKLYEAKYVRQIVRFSSLSPFVRYSHLNCNDLVL